MAALILGGIAPGLASAEVSQEPEELAPGLVLTIQGRSAEGKPVRAVHEAVAPRAEWGKAGPDARVVADGFEASWSGWLLVQAPGTHRFHARLGSGDRVRVRVGEATALEGAGGSVEGGPLTLEPGLLPFRVELRHEAGPSRVAIDWEGPSFPREPLPAHVLFREAGSGAADGFVRGRGLALRLGCVNCHVTPGLAAHRGIGPPLEGLAQSIDREWLESWLTNPTGQDAHARMPGLGAPLAPEKVADLIAYLESRPGREAALNAEAKMALNVADAGQGRLLFRSLGCLGCHTRGEEPGATSTSMDRPGPDLGPARASRSAASMALFLGANVKGPKPGSVHRPELGLTPDAAAHLAAYLARPSGAERATTVRPKGDVDRGRELARSLRCQACHEAPDLGEVEPAAAFGALRDPAGGCLAPDPPAGAARYVLTDEERRALGEFGRGWPASAGPVSRQEAADDLIRRWNCLGCHARDARGGEHLATQLAQALETDTELNALKGTLTPPNLTAVGAKLRPEYLRSALEGKGPSARPWLSVRMPRFPLSEEEIQLLAEAFAASDAGGASGDERSVVAEVTRPVIERGVALLGREGFGCTSCHVIDGKIPPGGEAETMGPDLAMAHRRLPDAYFRRWLADPQRILPGTPMPQFLQPAPGHAGTLGEQVESIWAALGSKDLPALAAVASRQRLARVEGRAQVVRDMILVPEAPGTYFPRGVTIGLENERNLLFDGDRLAWAAWWTGGLAYRTKAGRLWEWHPDGPIAWAAPALHAPVWFVAEDGRAQSPEEVRERFGSLREVRFLPAGGVSIDYTIHAPRLEPVRVEERIEPVAKGWTRTVRITPPAGEPRRMLVLEAAPGDGVGRVLIERGQAADDVDAPAGFRFVAPVREGDGSMSAGIRVELKTD